MSNATLLMPRQETRPYTVWARRHLTQALAVSGLSCPANTAADRKMTPGLPVAAFPRWRGKARALREDGGDPVGAPARPSRRALAQHLPQALPAKALRCPATPAGAARQMMRSLGAMSF